MIFGHLNNRRPGVLGRSNVRPRQPIEGDYTARQHPHELKLRCEDEGPLVRQSFVIGVDLGAMVDPAAAAVVRQRTYDERFCGPRDPHTDVIWLQRWPNCANSMRMNDWVPAPGLSFKLPWHAASRSGS